jgi:cephalosporin-C deacetylase
MFKIILLGCLLAFTGLCNVHAQETEDPKGEILIDTRPGNKSAIYSDHSSITYKLDVKSTYNVKQDGKLTYELLTDDWKKVYSSSRSVRLGKKGSGTYNIRIPRQTSGIYRVHFMFNLTYYDDTVKRVVAVSPEKIKTESFLPVDFSEFWTKSIDQLHKVAPDYKVTEDDKKSTRDVKVYKVEMRSFNNVPIRGWLTVPTEGKNWPVIYKLPGYNIAMQPETDKPDFAVFSLDVRGNGMSRDKVAPSSDRYNLTNVENRDLYIYHGVYMDCIRGLDFIMDKGQEYNLNTKHVCAYGGSQGATLAIVTAALDKRITACTFELPLYAGMHDAYRIGTSYPKTTWPMNRFQEYLKTHRTFTTQRFLSIWDYYDPQNFISRIKVPVLMGVGLLDEFCPPRCSFGMYNKLTTSQKEYIVAPDKAHEMNFDYFMFQLLWFKESLRAPN